jgi:phage terminase large subunit-like protein
MCGRAMARRRSPPARVTAADIITFIERFCITPEGAHVGEPIRLTPWQRRFIVDVYDNPAGTRRAILSVPRKNGKSALIACLILAHLAGPAAKHRPNSQLYSAARSRDQAAVVFNLMAKMVRMHPELARAVTIKDTRKEAVCRELGTSFRALSADFVTAYGLSPSMIVHDELGLVRGDRDELFEALETSVAAQVSPLSIVISTQARSDGDLLSLLIDDALRPDHDPRVTCTLFSAGPDLDPFSEEALEAANPALHEFMNHTEVLQMMRDAQRLPSRQREYENLVLNRRVQVTAPFIPQAAWENCRGTPAPLDGLQQVYGGLDLSSASDLTALVLIGWQGNKWHVRPTFWLPQDSLHEKSAQDHAPYDRWYQEGHLQLSPGRTISYEFVAHHLRQVVKQHPNIRIGFDRWKFPVLKEWLIKAGFTEQAIAARFVEFGQGMQSMSPAMRDLEQVILDGQLVHNSPVLTMNIAHVVTTVDDAGNRKPSKRKSTHRIDGAVGLLMALGVSTGTPRPIEIEALIG